jgi:hypothetical protein
MNWEALFTQEAKAAMEDLPEEYYADPDDDPLANLAPSMTYIGFSGQDGKFSEGDGDNKTTIGEELHCVILDIARTRDLWTPQPGEPLHKELSDFPTGRPLCQNRDADNEGPRLNQDLSPAQESQLRAMGAGDCNTCELTKHGCRGGRKLLVFNPRWAEPVILQVHGTSIGGINQMLRRDFKVKGRSIGLFSRAVRLWSKKCEQVGDNGKKISYYQIQGEAMGYLDAANVQVFLSLRDMYRIRALGGGGTGTGGQAEPRAWKPEPIEPIEEGRLI